MKIFSKAYDQVLTWSAHPKASRFLALVSLAESSFFPIPPDVMLAPMVLAKPKKAWRLAFLTTFWSTVGGIIGYCIGAFLFDTVAGPLIDVFNSTDSFEHAQALFKKHGIIIIFAAGFTPIPYKLFTISAGIAGMAIAPFVVASFIGRGARFFLVSWLVGSYGPRFEERFKQYFDIIGYSLSVLLIIFILYTLK